MCDISVTEDWSYSSLYFCESKLLLWFYSAEQAQDACEAVRKKMKPYFDEKQKDLMLQLTGEYLTI